MKIQCRWDVVEGGSVLISDKKQRNVELVSHFVDGSEEGVCMSNVGYIVCVLI